MQWVSAADAAGFPHTNSSSSETHGTGLRPDPGNRATPAPVAGPIASSFTKATGDQVKVAVQLFAHARDLAGQERVELELTEPVSVGDERSALAVHGPQLVPVADGLLIAVRGSSTRAPEPGWPHQAMSKIVVQH